MDKNSANRRCCFYETLEKRLPATTNTTLNVVPYPFALNTLSDRTLPPLPLSLKYNLAMNILTTNATDTFCHHHHQRKTKEHRSFNTGFPFGINLDLETLDLAYYYRRRHSSSSLFLS